jgi:hypothetical protein
MPLVLVLAVLAAGAPPAGAAGTGFCGVARGVARDIVASTSFSNGRLSPAGLKATYLRVKAAEPSLLATAPRPVKTNLRPVFGLINTIVADFQKVDWSTAGFVKYVPALAPRAEALTPQMQALRRYFRGTCHIDV